MINSPKKSPATRGEEDGGINAVSASATGSSTITLIETLP